MVERSYACGGNAGPPGKSNEKAQGGIGGRGGHGGNANFVGNISDTMVMKLSEGINGGNGQPGGNAHGNQSGKNGLHGKDGGNLTVVVREAPGQLVFKSHFQ